MKTYKPDRRAQLTLSLVLITFTLFLLFVVRLYAPVVIVVAIIAAALATVDIFFVCIYFPTYFSTVSYDATPEKIIRHGGAFIKTHKSVRLSTIQYASVITTPFSRYTGLNFVVFFVYGGHLRLFFMKHDDAMEILALAMKEN